MQFNAPMDEFMMAYLIKSVPLNLDNAKTMLGLIDDEAAELSDEVTILRTDYPAIVKEAIDTIYIAAQQLRRMGVDVDACFKEVHRSNMSKAIPLDGSVSLSDELEIARKRYPKAGVVEGQRVAVLVCGDTGKVIKPTIYSKAVITDEMIGK